MEIQFAHGIPGFEHLKGFRLVQEEDSGVFANLQSVEDENIAFLVADPFLFYPDYEFELPEHIKEDLKLQDESDVQVWGIVTVGGTLEDSTLNLMAPIIINRRLGLGRQVILQKTPYQTKHRLFPQTADPVQAKG